MQTIQRTAVAVILLAAIVTSVWALADSKSVNFLFEAAWEVNPELPGGGVIVSRGEGSNGVITVNLPMPPPTETVEPPIGLTADDVTYMDIEVTDAEGVKRHYTNDHIHTVNYRIELEYQWDNGISQKYVVENTVQEK